MKISEKSLAEIRAFFKPIPVPPGLKCDPHTTAPAVVAMQAQGYPPNGSCAACAWTARHGTDLQMAASILALLEKYQRDCIEAHLDERRAAGLKRPALRRLRRDLEQKIPEVLERFIETDPFGLLAPLKPPDRPRAA